MSIGEARNAGILVVDFAFSNTMSGVVNGLFSTKLTHFWDAYRWFWHGAFLTSKN
jgi:hypothetical protein